MTDHLEHERFCLPRPGEAEVRTETYRLPRTGQDGITIASWATVHRCLECGRMNVDGQRAR